MRASVIAAVAAVSWPAVAAAQADGGSPRATPSELERAALASACVRARMATASTRVPVFVRGEVRDRADSAARLVVDGIAQEVGVLLRARLWPTPAAAAAADSAGRLPAADSVRGPTHLAGTVRLTATRDGRVQWRADPPPDSAAALGLLAEVVAAARDAGALFVPGDVIRGDSLAFTLTFVRPRVSGQGQTITVVRERNPTPVFTLAVPWEEHAAPLERLVLRYPPRAQRGGFEGRVTLDFVVDTAGRVEPGTVRATSKVSGPSPRTAFTSGPGRDPGDASWSFVQVARDALQRARFRPATAAGCPMRELVRQAITFNVGP